MEFRPRNYIAEEQAHALPRVRADDHPLFTPSQTNPQASLVDDENNDFFDPLRAPVANAAASTGDLQDAENTSTVGSSNETASELPAKEWTSFKRLLMQRFPVSKMVSISSVSNAIMKGGKAYEKSTTTSMHLEELDDPQRFAEEGVKVITRQEYVSRLHELKDEIIRAWSADDRVTSLKLSIKVARLMMDTSVLQFYPTLFVLAIDVMDMLGDMVWKRIKQKAEFAEDGTFICSLPENFGTSDICLEAKETCNNWFCKIGSVRELLPRIYLELAMLPCWRFLLDQPINSLQRLVLMTRGLADPLASAYCRLYMAYCARKLPVYDIGYLITCINDIKILLTRIVSAKEVTHEFTENRRLLVSLMEPSIEYIVKCIFKDASQRQVANIIVELGLARNQEELFGNFPCVSVVLYHILKELPTEVVSSNAVEILHLIECSNDNSFDQSLNYRLVGFRLCESRSLIARVNAVVDKVIMVATQYDTLDKYLKVVDAYIDIVLLNQMDNHLNAILEGISKRACNGGIGEDELENLQSIFVKLLSHFKDVEDVFSLNHFLEVLDVMYGTSRNIVNMHLLTIATRNGYVHNPTTIQLLFEISQALHDGIDYENLRYNDDQQPAHLISRFVCMVDHGAELEQHLTFLIECRRAFGSINELKETLIHSSNCLAIRALKDAKKHLGFVRSCIAFSESTIPSISAPIRQLNLYIETSEVALLGGLVSHSDGLIDSAISCLCSLDLMDGSRKPGDIDGLLSCIRKLCSLLVIAPGNPEGVICIPKSILTVINSQSWMTPVMRIRICCALISLMATLSQNKLPYHTKHTEILSNDLLFFGDSSYLRELVSLADFILENLVDAIEREPSRAVRGSMALEACNCIASSFTTSREISSICTKLIETAKFCLSGNHKYLQSTIKFLGKHYSASSMEPSIAV